MGLGTTIFNREWIPMNAKIFQPQICANLCLSAAKIFASLRAHSRLVLFPDPLEERITEHAVRFRCSVKITDAGVETRWID